MHTPKQQRHKHYSTIRRIRYLQAKELQPDVVTEYERNVRSQIVLRTQTPS